MNKCFECETTEDLQEHHIVPRSRGGKKTVTLCYECHMKAHGRSGKGLNHSLLTKQGLAKSTKPLGSHNPKVLAGRYNAGKKTIERLFSHIQSAEKDGFTTRMEVSNYLNERGVLTPHGRKWTKESITYHLRKIRKALADGVLQNVNQTTEKQMEEK